ncbi:MAG TPA: ATP-binding protein [Terriglobales bacterium]|nr:ATP-binding protein [Terriglobales bacterium]
MTATPKAIPEGMLTELQRQDEYIRELPENFEFPLFSGRQAVESQRKSGYQTTAHAAREIVDNAIEAGAANVWIALERVSSDRRGKYERKDAITAIAFIDDASGMRPKMARFALSWGGGTHTKDPNFIAKFGFGLPNSSINQTRRVEVFTRTVEDSRWMRAVLDINEIPPYGLMQIGEPVEAKLPSFVSDFLNRKEIRLQSGTVVVWQKPDRLTWTQATVLKKQLRNDFSVVYRYVIDRVNLHIEDELVRKVDQLFLTPDALYYLPPDEGGAVCQFERNLAVKYWRDETTGTPHLEQLKSASDIETARKETTATVGTIHVKVARFPYGFVLGESKHKGTDPYRRFEIRKSRRGMSFVRAGREIETVDIFPTSAADEASGLGSWPVLQSYALHWGLEVRFGPELDEVFGIGNDKQTVRPIEDFWRVMADAEVDRATREEELHQRGLRKKDTAEQSAREAASPDKPNPATEAAALAEEIGGPAKLPEERKQEAQKELERAAQERSRTTGETVEQATKAIEEESRRKRYAIDFFDSEGGVFYMPSLGTGLQRIAKVNKRHAFFELFYARLAALPDPRPRQVVDLLLLALAQAELKAEGVKRTTYENEREREWSPFLGNALKILEQLEYKLSDDDQ